LNKPSIYGTVEYDLTENTTLSPGTMYNKTDHTAFFGLPAYVSGTQVHVPPSTLYGADWNRWTLTNVGSA
jgi:outer membrane receptor for ferric coprogen and ferric-rhodotorulic acid